MFFDGECGLCQRLVRWLLRLDRRGGLRLAPLKGPTAQAWLREHGQSTRHFTSLIYLPEGLEGRCPHLRKTDGVIAALHAIGHPRLARCLGLAPRGLRDGVYRVVARSRRLVFGSWKPGQPLNPAWQQRLLD
jgi:predicted DCC family thiol-disulfide oxidoreductase YuxK